jgi:hypothetical protein
LHVGGGVVSVIQGEWHGESCRTPVPLGPASHQAVGHLAQCAVAQPEPGLLRAAMAAAIVTVSTRFSLSHFEED